MNKTLLIVALVLILWMVYHRNDEYYETKHIEKIKKEAVKNAVPPAQIVPQPRANCGALTPLDQIIWAYKNQPQALLTPDSPLFPN